MSGDRIVKGGRFILPSSPMPPTFKQEHCGFRDDGGICGWEDSPGTSLGSSSNRPNPVIQPIGQGGEQERVARRIGYPLKRRLAEMSIAVKYIQPFEARRSCKEVQFRVAQLRPVV
jgi:hypothetical protein